MKTKYKEIFKLKRMLEKDDIPFDWIENFGYGEETVKKMKEIDPDMEHYQICYPQKGENRWISVIEGYGTYGGEHDTLEIMGGFAPIERFELKLDDHSVMGHLTAKNVYRRIKNHYKERK